MRGFGRSPVGLVMIPEIFKNKSLEKRKLLGKMQKMIPFRNSPLKEKIVPL